MDEIESLLSEINQMREQYVAGVGEGRRKWPRSIKERILKLIDLGLRMRQIAERAGIPYETVCQWKYQRDQKPEAFHSLPVVVKRKQKPSITNAGTVTAPYAGHPRSRPGSQKRTAIEYSLKRWAGLTCFLDDLKLPISNNEVERTIRHAVMGWKNYYVAPGKAWMRRIDDEQVLNLYNRSQRVKVPSGQRIAIRPVASLAG
jgi:hypothetical protein